MSKAIPVWLFSIRVFNFTLANLSTCFFYIRVIFVQNSFENIGSSLA